MSSFIESIGKKKISRRKFLVASAASTAGLALIGCSSNTLSKVSSDIDNVAVSGEGKWVSAACWHNCGARCVNKALVLDGVVLRQKTDDSHPDSQEYPQQRSCVRGRSQQQQIFNADRIKYPMKRKHWEPGGGDRSLRGRDEWERISWDEALDIVASEIKRAKEKYGSKSILSFTAIPPEFSGSSAVSGSQDPSKPVLPSTVHPVPKVLNAYGGTSTVWDTRSLGVYKMPWENIGLVINQSANDRMDLYNSDVVILYGINSAWSFG
ncbi:MAG: molybdopterin-dependent oxidoreductase, partial [Bacillota bacterium]